MPPVHFHVSHSQTVTDEFRRHLETARSLGQLPLAIRAGRYIWDELAYDPLAFGESRDHLVSAGLKMRVAFARPFFVEFAVDEQQRTVFIRKFVLLR